MTQTTLRLQQKEQTYQVNIRDLCVWLAVFSSFMLWLWQLSYGTFDSGSFDKSIAIFGYGLALVSLPILFLRWAGINTPPRVFVIVAACGVLLVHLSINGEPSTSSMLYIHFGSPSMGTFVFASIAATRLLGNKSKLITHTQCNWFAVSVVIAFVASQLTYVMLESFIQSPHRSKEEVDFLVNMFSVLWAVVCVVAAIYCQMREKSLCALWLSLALVVWVLEGGPFYRTYVAESVSESSKIAQQPRVQDDECLTQPIASVLLQPCRKSYAVGRVRPILAGGRGVELALYQPYQRETVVAPAVKPVSVVADHGLGGWLSDWFVATCALLWLFRGGYIVRSRKDQ